MKISEALKNYVILSFRIKVLKQKSSNHPGSVFLWGVTSATYKLRNKEGK